MGIDLDELLATRRRSPVRRGRWWWLWALLLFAVFVGAGAMVDLAAEWLWFSSVGQAPVFRTRIVVPLALFVLVFTLVAFWLGANWLWARRRVAEATVWPGQRQSPLLQAGAGSLVIGLSALLAALLAAGAAAQWETVLLYLNRAPFGRTEPVLGRDVAFYVFELPLLQLAHAIAMSALFTALVGAAVIYFFGGVLDLRLYSSADGMRELRRRVSGLPGHVRTHLWLLAALWALLWAAGQWLARFDLLFVGRQGGRFFGPGYTDVVARLPVHNALAVVGVLVAFLFLVTLRGKRGWLPLGGLALVFTLRVLLLGAYPALMQKYRIAPDELAFERPYISNNIELTRAAFRLDDVAEAEYALSGELTPELMAEHSGTLENVRLWDWRSLLETFRQLQEIRAYYDFLDVDIDRYQLDEGQRQVELSIRELTPSVLEELQNPTWVNRHLEFTHGFGVVVTPVDEADRRGLPVLWVRDIPPTTVLPFDREIAQPRVYFGEAADDGYVIVRTLRAEFDYPAGAQNVRTTYDGADGIRLASLLHRLLFALRFGDQEILFTGAVTPESRILVHRNIGDRVRRLAPFLVYDPDPYMVITDEGRLVWIMDAYTATDRYPYSRPVAAHELQFGDAGLRELGGQNYVRNSVKVVVDAYDGTAVFYVVDEDDPLINAWSQVYPTLFRPASDMSADLVAHWRYPEALFRAQVAIFQRYHMANPDTFYNAEDLWAVPTQTVEQDSTSPMQPYYVTMRLRSEPEEEFLLMLPFTPVRKQNMIAWLAARCDPGHYGELVLYSFAKGQLVLGPQQIESRIDQDPEISKQLTLWGQRGSRAIRGNMLVIPIEDSILYVEPLYLQAETSALPELKQVIVASGEYVVMRPRLDEALAALFEAAERPAAAVPAAGDTAEEEAAPAGEIGARMGVEELTDLASLVRAAQESERHAREALQAGDWVRFGREMDAWQRTLERLAALTGVEVSAGEPSAGVTPTLGSAVTPEVGEGP